MPGSKVSSQSKHSNATQSSKYKGKQSEVDENLFGTKQNKNSTQKTIKDNPQYQKIQKSVIQGDYSHPEVVVLPESELQRMKALQFILLFLLIYQNAAVIRTKDEQVQQKKILEEQKEKQQAAAKAKKEKMLRLEEEKKKQVPLNDIQLEEKEAKESMQTRAQEILNEELDEVKDMNKMMMYAKCVTVRDKQLIEKQKLHEQKKAEEKRKDLMMEIERLKKIKFYEEEERRKVEELKKGHAVIIDQIQERELKRLREKEEQEMEGQLILKEITALQKEESEIAISKKIEQKKQLDQILDANSDAILIKQKKIQMELEEEAKIVKYNQEKALKEAEYVAEQKFQLNLSSQYQRRIKDEKERDVQRLRELQEKAYDRQAELDALRAKRAMEQNERAAREREAKEAEIKKKINEDLQDARQLQALEKEKRLQEQAKLERDEFQRIIQVQKQERDIELKLGKEKSELVKKHADELRKQIGINEEKDKQVDKDRLEEGKKIKDKQQKYKALVEGIKEKKLQEMKSMGISPKYQAELSKFKVQ